MLATLIGGLAVGGCTRVGPKCVAGDRSDDAAAIRSGLSLIALAAVESRSS